MNSEDHARDVLQAAGRSLCAISPDHSVHDAVARMAILEASALPVMEQRELLGIISEHDYVRKVVLLRRLAEDVRVREVMTAPVIFVSPDDTVEGCLRIMATHGVQHLPVLERGIVLGVISIRDLVEWITLVGVRPACGTPQQGPTLVV